MDHPSSAPRDHRAFLDRAVPLLACDHRIQGIAAGGSYALNAMDAFSDVDLVVVCDEVHRAALLQDLSTLAGRLGPMVAAFTGEHLGEPALLICLYGPPALHVDIKLVTPAGLARIPVAPVVLWDRSGIVAHTISTAALSTPQPDGRWIEERFWVWVHYGALKIARGELQEALDFLSFLRVQVLGPLGLQRYGLKPYGVRRVETRPRLAAQLARTVARLHRPDLFDALEHAVKLYLELRPGDVVPNLPAQAVALDHLAHMRRQAAN